MPGVDTIENPETQAMPPIHNEGVGIPDDELLGLVAEDEGVLKSSTGQSATDNGEKLWTNGAEATAQTPITEPQPAETVVAPPTQEPVEPTVAPAVAPEAPASPSVTMGDSVFASQAEVPKPPVQEDEAFGENVTINTGTADTLIKEREINPSRGISKSIPAFHEQLGQDLEAGIAASDAKLDERMDREASLDAISDPGERFEARVESVKGSIAEMKKDLLDLEKALDGSLIKAKAEADQAISEADVLEAEAKEKSAQAYSKKVNAQNKLTEIQGEISGKKSQIAKQLEQLEQLENIKL